MIDLLYHCKNQLCRSGRILFGELLFQCSSTVFNVQNQLQLKFAQMSRNKFSLVSQRASNLSNSCLHKLSPAHVPELQQV